MKWIKRILLGLVVIIVLLFAFVQLTWQKTYDTPALNLTATKDSAKIERGRYLAYGPAHCATCHMPMDKIEAVEAGAVFPLSGGWEFDIPPATIRAPNLTPDDETGIGKRSDAEIVRALRYSINHRGGVMLPLMPFQEISDEDVVSILSFLRSQPPVKHAVEPTEYKFLGKALLAFGVLKPEGPKQTPPANMPKDSTETYGAYLANRVANCVGCHTERDMKTGAFVGEPFAGGMYFGPDIFTKGYSYLSPNLTPDQATGRLAGWNEQQFIARFRQGRIQSGSPMPWGSFSKMDESDLKALFAYLSKLAPVNKKIEKYVFAPGEKPQHL